MYSWTDAIGLAAASVTTERRGSRRIFADGGFGGEEVVYGASIHGWDKEFGSRG